MINNINKWEKLGRILTPDPQINWLTYAGSAHAIKIKGNLYDVLVTGRDESNRSVIGKIKIKISDSINVLSIESKPTFQYGELGAFDENGVSYPCVVKDKRTSYLYYTGWMPSILTPFQNHVGLAKWNGHSFIRISKAPILERNNDDYLSTGSVFVMKENAKWHMWYTAFVKWENENGKIKHYYKIKYAESIDGINWKRENIVCIDFKNENEYAICRPSVIKHNGMYHMYFCYRGDTYKIGYAYSKDGKKWEREDNLAGINYSSSGWDSKELCYPNIFQHKNQLYMLYCGNNYGKEGLGMARLQLY